MFHIVRILLNSLDCSDFTTGNVNIQFSESCNETNKCHKASKFLGWTSWKSLFAKCIKYILSNQIYFLLFWTVYCECYPMLCMSRTVLIGLVAMYGTGFCLFVKINACFLRRRCRLIWKRKQHTFWDICSSIKILSTKRLFGLKSFKSKQCENKLSSRQRKPSL